MLLSNICSIKAFSGRKGELTFAAKHQRASQEFYQHMINSGAAVWPCAIDDALVDCALGWLSLFRGFSFIGWVFIFSFLYLFGHWVGLVPVLFITLHYYRASRKKGEKRE